MASFFTTFTMLGTPTDITTQELCIELFHPADAGTQALMRATSGSADP